MPTFRVVSSQAPVTIDAESSMHPVHATSNALAGTIEFELDDQGRLNLDAPYAAHLKLPVDTISSGNGLQDREMRRRLDNKRFPDIAVDVTSVEKADDNGHYSARARISVGGNTQEVEGDVVLTVDGDRLVVEGEKKLDMRDFGIEPPRLLILKVQPEVVVRARIVAERQG